MNRVIGSPCHRAIEKQNEKSLTAEAAEDGEGKANKSGDRVTLPSGHRKANEESLTAEDGEEKVKPLDRDGNDDDVTRNLIVHLYLPLARMAARVANPWRAF